MKKTLCIIIGKFIVKLGNIMKGRGSSLPGTIARKIEPNILKQFNLPKNVIAITGSSGKGSTSKMIADIYKAQGYTVAHNYKGANLVDGILSTFIEYSDLKGNIRDYASINELICLSNMENINAMLI